MTNLLRLGQLANINNLSILKNSLQCKLEFFLTNLLRLLPIMTYEFTKVYAQATFLFFTFNSLKYLK